MKLNDFMKLHTKVPKLNYTIELYNQYEENKLCYLDYADYIDSPWENYFADYFACDVVMFDIIQKNDKIILRVVIQF